MSNLGESVPSTGGEELDEASVWEAEQWKAREDETDDDNGDAADSDAPPHERRQSPVVLGDERGREGKENCTTERLVGGKRQSSVLQDEFRATTPEKEDSSKSTHSNLKLKKHSFVSTPTTEYIPIKQSRRGDSGGPLNGSGYSQSVHHSDLRALDQSIFVGLMGTSAPIQIPDSVHNQFYKKRGNGESGVLDSPRSSTRAADFVPPHLIGTVADVDVVEDPDLSSSVLKRDQLKRRNTILSQTGFLQ